MPAPRALLLAFGDNALEFELRAYVDNVEVGLGTRSDLHLAILRRFRAARIVIPCPLVRCACCATRRGRRRALEGRPLIREH